MICCLNPDCRHPQNKADSKFCIHCGQPLEALLINRFKVLDLLGQGGFGRTYLALDTQKLDEQCVLKQLVYRSRENQTASRAESMFYEEARQLQVLGSHRQIPALYAFFIHNSNQYLVQELIEGNTLKQELASGPFSEPQIGAVLSDLLPVLEFIHRQNVIHRDIKPENIMRCRHTNKLMLIDFGISKTFSIETLSRTGTIVGSHGYSSKEQILEGKSTPATDLFSLGVTCFHLMTQISPMELSVNYGFSWVKQWRSHLSYPITPEFETLMTRLLAIEVGDRYPSAQAVLDDLIQLPKAPDHLPETAFQQPLPHRSEPTTDLNPDPFLTLNSLSSPPDPTPVPKPIRINRRQALKYLGFGGMGSLGAIALWQVSKRPTQMSQRTNKSISLKGRQTSQGFFETVSVDRSGQIQQRAIIEVELIREDLGNDIYLDLVSIPTGSFLMGSPASESNRDDDESPRHMVTLKTFLMGLYEVTQQQWQAVAQMPAINIDLRLNDSTFRGSTRPVERVTWAEAVEFCQRLSRQTGHRYRLPAESEWEYACRAGTSSPFAYGATLSSTLANFDANSTYGQAPQGEFRKRTTEVGGFFANAWGLHDMHGNVLEWCADHWHDSYENAPTDGTAWITDGDAKLRVQRGGSWFDPPRISRSANRSKNKPNGRYGDVGFRVVCDLSA